MADARRTSWWLTGGGRKGPPPKIFIAVGAVFLAINHLSVVFNSGIQPEALAMGCWLVMTGGWVLVSPRSFDAVWGWIERPGRSMVWVLAAVIVMLAAACGAAEAVAWFGYGQHLWK